MTIELKVEDAIVYLAGEAICNVTPLEAMQLSQAALNLAHAYNTLVGAKVLAKNNGVEE